jgi:hypothetical protein
MKRAVIIFYSSVWLCIATGCSTRMGRQDYIAWVRDYENGLHKQQVSNEFVFDLQYKPSEYIFLQRNPGLLSDSQKSEELQKISSIQYYTLILSNKDKIDLVEYGVNNIAEKQQKEYYFSYNFQDDITLEEDNKVLPCVLFHFERPSTPDGGRTFVLGFENQDKFSSEANIIIRSDLLGSLPVKIKIIKSNTPQVDL